jgi:hypothetical protein
VRALRSSSAQNWPDVQVLARFISRPPDLRKILRSLFALDHRIARTELLRSFDRAPFPPESQACESDMRDLDPSQYGEADRREVNPPIEVESATWSADGMLDWWVKERQQWLGRVRGPDGRQRWIKASDIRPVARGQMTVD